MNPIVILDKPIKKQNAYLSRLTVNGKRTVKINIPYGILKQALVLSNKQGFLAEIRVPVNDYSVEYMTSIENACVKELIKENANWFKNGLCSDKITDMLETCISRGTSLHVYASNVRSSGISDDGLISINEWFEKYKNLTKVALTIACDGLYIYSDKYGLRWVITEIREYQEPEDISPDIDELVAYWKDKTVLHIEKLEKSLSNLKEIYKNINSNNLETEVEKLNMEFSQNNFI